MNAKTAGARQTHDTARDGGLLEDIGLNRRAIGENPERSLQRQPTRVAVYAADGTVDGPLIKGRVVPMSGGDWPLVRPNGVIDFDARYLLELADGTIVYLQSRGYRWANSPEVAERMARNEPAGHDEYYMRVSPKFDVPEGPHDWLGKYVFVGVAEKVPNANRIHYFKVL